MKVGVTGLSAFGAREHVLVETLRRQNPDLTIYCYPGSFATEKLGVNVPIKTAEDVTQHAKTKGLDLVIVGPEGDLSMGLSDQLEKEGIAVFGPTQKGAQIESNKHFAKELMREKNVHTAPFRFFPTAQDALHHLKTKPMPYVIKASGLAAGKGVLVVTKEDSFSKVEEFLKNEAIFKEGLIVEEFLKGQEASLFYLVNSKAKIAVPLISARDYKRALDQDKGLNTGGMGAFSHFPFMDEEKIERVTKEIVRPVLEGLEEKEASFTGVLYCGLMMADDEISVVEFNARFGDPEVQVILPRLKSSFLELLLKVKKGEPVEKPEFDARYALNVVLASKGYPQNYEKGKAMKLPEALDDIHLYFAGVKREDQKLVTNGGRVMSVVAFGNTLNEAKEKAYQFIEEKGEIFEGMTYRKDIGSIYE